MKGRKKKKIKQEKWSTLPPSWRGERMTLSPSDLRQFTGENKRDRKLLRSGRIDMGLSLNKPTLWNKKNNRKWDTSNNKKKKYTDAYTKF